LKKYLNILRKCPLFYGIEEENLLRMLKCLGARVEYFDKKYTVFSEGSPAKYVGIVLSGSVQVVQVDFEGNRSILSEMNPSEVFAEAFACAEVSALPVSIIANEPGEIMLIECSHVLHTCANHCSFHQQLIFNLMKDLALKTIFFHQRMEITAKRTTREKLLAYLHSQAKKTGALSFEIPFDRQELADFLEVDRSGLSTEIGKLKKEGIIEAEKKRFTILMN
jgi:CRP-like cAMP-binding protein